MHRALAIETSGRVGSVAILEDRHIAGEDQFPHGLQNAAHMIPRIDRLCVERGWKPGDFNEIYVSVGPGSFTGLRIGVTLAKTLAFVTGARLVAAPSVRVLARNAPAEARNLIVILDAKRGQVFTARFSREGASWVEQEPAHLDDLASMLARSPRPVWLLGEGVSNHRQFVPENDGSIIVTSPELWQPRAAAVAAEGVAMAAAGQFVEPDQLIPLYIRRPEAEEVWERKHGEMGSAPKP